MTPDSSVDSIGRRVDIGVVKLMAERIDAERRTYRRSAAQRLWEGLSNEMRINSRRKGCGLLTMPS